MHKAARNLAADGRLSASCDLVRSRAGAADGTPACLERDGTGHLLQNGFGLFDRARLGRRGAPTIVLPFRPPDRGAVTAAGTGDDRGMVTAHAPAHEFRETPNIGECWARISRPGPKYMWTPQGRQGSKLRTARRMSIPLKSSGPFSSKIGVFWIASS